MVPFDRLRIAAVGGALLVSVLLTSVAVPATTATTSPTVVAESVEADPGDEVSITIAVNGASDVAGYQANLTFDPEVAQVVDVSGADFADPVVNSNNQEGWVFLTQSQADGVQNPKLATITFEITEDPPGGTSIAFVAADTMVNDAEGNEVSASLENGAIQVESSSQTRTTTRSTTTTTSTPITNPTTTTSSTTTNNPVTTATRTEPESTTTDSSSTTTAQPTRRSPTESTTSAPPSPTETLRTSGTSQPETTSAVEQTTTTGGGGGSGSTPGFSLGIGLLVVGVMALVLALKRTP